MAEKKKKSIFEFMAVMLMAGIAIVADKIGGKKNRGEQVRYRD